MSKKNKPNRTPFYAQVITQKVRQEQEARLKALHAAASRVIKPKDTPPKGNVSPA
jgi:hypothetical protein